MRALETPATKRARARPAHDRQHRPLARAALHVPVLHRRRRRTQLPGASPRADIQFGPISLSCIDLAQHGRLSIVVLLARRLLPAAHAHRQGDARDLRQPAASPRHPASTSTASSASCGSSRGVLAALVRHPVGVLPPRASSGTWASQMLLLIFAAVTLGGLGTAFGALLGSLIVGLVVELSTLLAPAGHEVRGRAGRADPHPAGQTSGHPGSQRENGVGATAMDWGADSLEHGSASCSARRRSRTRSRRPVSPCTSATPACSTSVWPASWPLGAYGYAISMLSRSDGPWWARHARSALGASVVFAIILGIPTLRLRADYLAIVTIAAAEIVRLLFTTQLFDEWTNSADGLAGYQRGFRAANPFPQGTLRLRPVDVQRDRLWVRVFGLGSLAIAAVLLVWVAHAQPVGPRAQGHPRRRGRRALARQERLRYKMQASSSVASSAPWAACVFVLPRPSCPSQLHDRRSRSSSGRSCCSAVRRPCSVRSLGSVIFWVVLALLLGHHAARAARPALPLMS